MVLLIHRLRVVKLQVWISAQPILAQPNLTLDRSTARALGRSQSTDSTLERFQTTVKLTRLLQGTDLAEPRYYSLVFGFKNQATDLVSHEWLIGRVSYCVCISSNQINSRHRFSYSFADSLPHSLILSLSLPCNLTLTQSRTHTHSLSLVLVVMMKSKELKTKISHAYSLILSLAFQNLTLSSCDRYFPTRLPSPQPVPSPRLQIQPPAHRPSPQPVPSMRSLSPPMMRGPPTMRSVSPPTMRPPPLRRSVSPPMMRGPLPMLPGSLHGRSVSPPILIPLIAERNPVADSFWHGLPDPQRPVGPHGADTLLLIHSLALSSSLKLFLSNS